MAQSQVNLYNLALALVGADYTVASTSEESVPAETCELFYENVRETVLMAAFWNSAKQFARLVEVTERDLSADWATTDPAPGYAYSYDIPSNMLRARYLTSFSQFELHYDTGNSKMVINANEGSDTATETPIICYTIDVTDVTRWEPDLYKAVYYAMAAHICMPLNGKITRARETAQAANDVILEARAQHLNEMNRMWAKRPHQLAVRGYEFSVEAPYYYPFGGLITATGAPII